MADAELCEPDADSATAAAASAGGARPVLLAINELQTSFFLEGAEVKAVDGVTLTIPEGRTVGLVGESGCGKSVTSLSIMRLIPDPPGKIVGGSIRFRERELTTLSDAAMRRVRGNDIAMIFQEPMTSLNPVFTIGNQIIEAIVLHRGKSAAEARLDAIALLDKVGIPDPELRVDDYPHQMSGGMKQRVMIAMALSCNPDLLIADEPTTALDVTIQAQILDLMRSLQAEFGMSILFITHDLGVVAEMAHEVAVMYASKIVEHTDAETLFAEPRHPYTLGLFHSIPKIGEHRARLDVIPGSVPNPLDFPKGCKFHNRCLFALALDDTGDLQIDAAGRPTLRPLCSTDEPALAAIAPGHTCRCHYHEEVTPDGWRARSTAVSAQFGSVDLAFEAAFNPEWTRDLIPAPATATKAANTTSNQQLTTSN